MEILLSQKRKLFQTFFRYSTIDCVLLVNLVKAKALSISFTTNPIQKVFVILFWNCSKLSVWKSIENIATHCLWNWNQYKCLKRLISDWWNSGHFYGSFNHMMDEYKRNKMQIITKIIIWVLKHLRGFECIPPMKSYVIWMQS